MDLPAVINFHYIVGEIMLNDLIRKLKDNILVDGCFISCPGCPCGLFKQALRWNLGGMTKVIYQFLICGYCVL